MKNSYGIDILKYPENFYTNISTPIQKIDLPHSRGKVQVFVKREDLTHPVISGNKWRKLKYNILEARTKGFTTLLTFGGAYSNHIHACAFAGKIFGFKTIGLIRGEQSLPLNPTLEFAKKEGMELHYIDRKRYRLKKEDFFEEELHKRFGDFYFLPEGGTNKLALKGCAEIIDDINIEFDFIAAACGTGGTLAGLIAGLKGNKKVVGIPVLKGAGFLYKEINSLLSEYSDNIYTNWELKLDYHFGGYAKISKPLIEFMINFENDNNILLDPVYTAKLFFGIDSMIEKEVFTIGSKIIVIHTGGIQGRAGMQNKVDKLLS